MKTLQKFICSLLSLSLLLSISNVAAANVESSFSGKIEVDSTSESIDLTNININVYQSIPREETATEWVTEYDETLAFTVHPNHDGVFTFTPPSSVFSLTVQMDTLPIGFGIDKHTELYYGINNDQNVFTLSQISDVELTSSSLYDYPNITILNEGNEEIYADFDFSPTYSQDVYNSNRVEISGAVKINGGIEFTPSTTVDLSGTDPFDRINQLFSVGIITEDEYLEKCMQMMEDDGTFDFCGVPLSSDVSTYGLETLPEEVQESIATLTSEVHNNYFKVHYNAKKTTKTSAEAVASFLLDMRSKSLSAGFKAPISDAGGNQINVYLSTEKCADPNPKFNPLTRGITYPTGSGSSVITIWNFSTLSIQEKETVAHEYFHTVQFAYQAGNTPSWFVEATAVWFAARYSGSIERAKGHFDKYFENCRQSVFNANLQYGAGVLPMAIDVAYGGPATIRNIYIRIGSIKPTNETSLESCITYGIQQYDKSGSFAEAFKKLGAYITLPKHFFQKTIPSGATWVNDYMFETTPSTAGGSKSVLLYSYGLQPYSFEAQRSDATFLSIVVGFNDKAKGNASVRVVTKTSSNVITPFGGDVPSNRYSTIIKFFANTPSHGSNNVTNAYVSPIYTGSSSCPVTITYSLSTVITS